jgi:hypothetical protein
MMVPSLLTSHALMLFWKRCMMPQQCCKHGENIITVETVKLRHDTETYQLSLLLHSGAQRTAKVVDNVKWSQAHSVAPAAQISSACYPGTSLPHKPSPVEHATATSGEPADPRAAILCCTRTQHPSAPMQSVHQHQCIPLQEVV